MDQAQSQKMTKKIEALKVRASEPTPLTEFYVYKTKMVAVFLTCIFFLLLSAGMLVLSGEDIVEAYQRHRIITSIFLGLVLLAIVRGIAWYIQKKRPVLILSDKGLLVDNMAEPLSLCDIQEINVSAVTSKLVETWTFHFKLTANAKEMQLPGIDHSSVYDKSTHTYRLETLELKGYDKEHVVKLIQDYKAIIEARIALNQ